MMCRVGKSTIPFLSLNILLQLLCYTNPSNAYPVGDSLLLLSTRGRPLESPRTTLHFSMLLARTHVTSSSTRQSLSSTRTSNADDDSMESTLSKLPSYPEEMWLCPFFGTIVETIRNHLEVDRSSKIPGPDPFFVYTLEEGFMPTDQFWIGDIQPDRMDREANVLYRPQIVDNLVQRMDRLYARRLKEGLMVKGPQGVGKSYTLINLTRYLLSTGKYVVTVIPDCNTWDDEQHFFNFLLQSVGVDPAGIGLMYDAKRDNNFDDLINDIDKVLSQYDMRWVFVFDQINAIFARDQFLVTRDVTKLPFPFSMIKRVLKPGRIISIISAPENNHVSYRKKHPGFEDFNHPVQLDRDEIEMLYTVQQIPKWGEWDALDYETGRVPLYLKLWVKGTPWYLGDIKSEIESSLDKLKREQVDDWESIVYSAIQCLLKLSSDETFPPRHFDRKYSVLLRENKTITIVPLFGFIEAVYRNYFWKDMHDFVCRSEATLRSICADPTTSSDVRGRLFEQMVIARSSTNGLTSDDLNKILMATDIDTTSTQDDINEAIQGGFSVVRFFGPLDPRLDVHENAGKIVLFIPRVVPNYRAIDLMFRVGSVVVAFQIQSSENHKDVLPLLQRNIEKARWSKEVIHTVFLIYLSPNPTTAVTTGKLKRRRETSSGQSSLGSRPPSVSTTIKYIPLYYSIDDFEHLKTMRW